MNINKLFILNIFICNIMMIHETGPYKTLKFSKTQICLSSSTRNNEFGYVFAEI